MQKKIDRFYIEDQEFRWWLTCSTGLNIARADQFEEWCDEEGYKEGEGEGMANERWEKHWIRQAKMITGALPSEC